MALTDEARDIRISDRYNNVYNVMSNDDDNNKIIYELEQ